MALAPPPRTKRRPKKSGSLGSLNVDADTTKEPRLDDNSSSDSDGGALNPFPEIPAFHGKSQEDDTVDFLGVSGGTTELADNPIFVPSPLPSPRPGDEKKDDAGGHFAFDDSLIHAKPVSKLMKSKTTGDIKIKKKKIKKKKKKKDKSQTPVIEEDVPVGQVVDEPLSPASPSSPTPAPNPPLVDHVGLTRSVSMPLVHRKDALAVMLKGTPFLKYGKRGYPHFRQVQLVGGNRVLQWFSKKKKLTETQVHLSSVDEIIMGQTTDNFQRIKAPELINSSFSIIYNNRQKTLDLVAKDALEYRLWTQGLSQLVAEIRAGRPVEKLQALMVEVDKSHMEPPKRIGSSRDLSGPAAITMGPTRGGDKAQTKPLWKKFDTLFAKFQRHRDTIRSNSLKYSQAQHYKDMIDKIDDLTDSFKDAKDMLRDGEYAEAEEILWQNSIQLETLTSMIKTAE